MRALIVKNCTKADFCKYTAECNGEKKEATLAQASPFVSKIADVEGYQGDIAVFECRVKPGSYVSWSQNGKKINKADFRYLYIHQSLTPNSGHTGSWPEIDLKLASVTQVSSFIDTFIVTILIT